MKARKTIPYLQDCIREIESAGYTYSHRDITRQYVFYRNSDHKEVAFTLSEIRDASKNGW